MEKGEGKAYEDEDTINLVIAIGGNTWKAGCLGNITRNGRSVCVQMGV